MPSDEENERLFGVPLATEGIQPVWLRIENQGEEPYWFAPAQLDPNYFTPLEAANRCRSARCIARRDDARCADPAIVASTLTRSRSAANP